MLHSRASSSWWAREFWYLRAGATAAARRPYLTRRRGLRHKPPSPAGTGPLEPMYLYHACWALACGPPGTTCALKRSPAAVTPFPTAPSPRALEHVGLEAVAAVHAVPVAAGADVVAVGQRRHAALEPAVRRHLLRHLEACAAGRGRGRSPPRSCRTPELLGACTPVQQPAMRSVPRAAALAA